MATETFGQHLRRLRSAAGFTQRALAERAGIALRSINDLENDQRERPRVATLHALADALELTTAQRVAFVASPGHAHIQQYAARREALFPHPDVLLGREADLAMMRAVASPHDAPDGVASAVRLMTLIGQAGVGKTALALHLAAEMVEDFRGEVYRVDLAGLLTPNDLPRAVARALSLPSLHGPNLFDALVGTIGSRALLVLLDGCDMNLDAVAALVAALLRRCADLRFVVTSREPLQVEGEFVWRVGPLAVPSGGAVARLQQEAVVRLFCARASLVAPTFALTSANGHLVRALCRRSGGLPLALGLIAAQLRRFPPAALVDQLAPFADSVPLPEVITWRYEHLLPADRALLRCLATFADSWPGSAADAFAPLIEGGRGGAGLRRLILGGLVQAEGQPHARRYRLLAPIRAHALDELRAAGTEARARVCHLDWCIGLARDAARPPGGRRHRPARNAALDAADPDLAAALIWALEHDPPRGRQLARFLGRQLPDRHADETSWARLLSHLGE